MTENTEPCLGLLASLQLAAGHRYPRRGVCSAFQKLSGPEHLRFVVKKTSLNPSDEISFDVAFAILKEKNL